MIGTAYVRGGETYSLRGADYLELSNLQRVIASLSPLTLRLKVPDCVWESGMSLPDEVSRNQ